MFIVVGFTVNAFTDDVFTDDAFTDDVLAVDGGREKSAGGCGAVVVSATAELRKSLRPAAGCGWTMWSQNAANAN